MHSNLKDSLLTDDFNPSILLQNHHDDQYLENLRDQLLNLKKETHGQVYV